MDGSRKDEARAYVVAAINREFREDLVSARNHDVQLSRTRSR